MKSISAELITKSRSLRIKEPINLKSTSNQKILTNNISIETMFKQSTGSLTIEKFTNPVKNIINNENNNLNSSNEKLSNYLVFKINDYSDREIHIDYVADTSLNPLE